jgi:hypothetical protein
MDNKIIELKSTTFVGKRFTRKQLEEIQETVAMLSGISRNEISKTICEHLNWITAKGSYKIKSCLSALEKMESIGIIILPEKPEVKKRPEKKILWTNKTNEQTNINCDISELEEILIKRVSQKEEVSLWNEYIDRYHYLNYKRPFGTNIRYFIISKKDDSEVILGCLLFSASAWALGSRDKWIGWSEKDRKKRLHLVVNNSRFLIFPWVNVKNLASKTLSIVSKQITKDWYEQSGYRPVLLETFVDSSKYTGSCYKAANWQYLGKTTGGNRTDRLKSDTSKKDIYLYPLVSNFKKILKNEKSTKVLRFATTTDEENDYFIKLWKKITTLIMEVAADYDLKWQKRNRIINTMLIVLFIFRLLFSKNKQSYKTTINELWDQCIKMNIELPQRKPIAASAICNARAKLDEEIFKILNSKIIDTYQTEDFNFLWKQHRVFAVDGSKINLPLKMKEFGYTTSCKRGNYPQGLASCLYQLNSQIPYDFDLSADKDERALAVSHLKVLQENDVVVYDRGYFSYSMLYKHIQKNVHVVFRLANNTYKIISDFIESSEIEKIVTIEINGKHKNKIKKKEPSIELIPLTLRLVKYTEKETTYTLGTTLIDEKNYSIKELSDLYHSRWGIEELYKISKTFINVEDFHGQTERGVKQELFAHFVLITINRIFSNYAEGKLEKDNEIKVIDAKDSSKLKINFKNCITTVSRAIEYLLLQQSKIINETISYVIDTISNCRQKTRPNRSYERKSMKPMNKWIESEASKKRKKAKAAIIVCGVEA